LKSLVLLSQQLPLPELQDFLELTRLAEVHTTTNQPTNQLSTNKRKSRVVERTFFLTLYFTSLESGEEAEEKGGVEAF